MVFSSHLFLYYFLPLTLLGYYLLPRRARHLGLTVASYAFYAWANPAFTLLMLLSTVVDYVCGRVIGSVDPAAPRSRRARWAVGVSVVTNLGLLAFFKYFHFAVDSLATIAGVLGLPTPAVESGLRVVLPLGISFYTFQSMSYTLDVYRGRARPLVDFVDFACYVSMFPQLVAGPILRFNEVADQLASRVHSVEKMGRGVVFICLGLSKKILLANPCGRIADASFDAAARTALDAWYGAFAYAFQIYFDFSGYSDMAIGLGLMLGFTFPKNFDSPYRADSVTDFWRRWHLSLSRWLRDYLYIPLGGNRRGRGRTYLNLMIVMLLGGLWHGAAWTFVLWGAIHGLALAGERALGKVSPYQALPRPLRVAATFALVTLAWVFFRAADLPSAWGYLGAMAGLVESPASAALVAVEAWRPYYLLSFAAAAVVAFAAPQTWNWSERLNPQKGAVALSLFALALVAMASQGYNPFIYFIF